MEMWEQVAWTHWCPVWSLPHGGNAIVKNIIISPVLHFGVQSTDQLAGCHPSQTRVTYKHFETLRCTPSTKLKLEV